MQHLFRAAARAIYYIFCVFAILSIVVMAGLIFSTLIPSKTPGSEFFALGLIFFIPIFFGVTLAEYVVYRFLKKESSYTVNIIITCISLSLVTIGLCALYVRMTST
jgi:hypothetical protein